MTISKLMKKLDKNVKMLEQGIAVRMMELAEKRFMPSALGDCLVLGNAAFASAAGMDAIGLRPLCIHPDTDLGRMSRALATRPSRKALGWARHICVNNLDDWIPNLFPYVFVWPGVDFEANRETFLGRLTEDGTAIVAQDPSVEIRADYENVTWLNGSGRECEPEEAKTVVFSVKKGE